MFLQKFFLFQLHCKHMCVCVYIYIYLCIYMFMYTHIHLHICVYIHTYIYIYERKKESESEVAQSCPTLCDTMDCIAHQALLPMGFSRQEYWSGLPFSSPGDLPDSGIELRSAPLQADALTSEPPGKPIFIHMFYMASLVAQLVRNLPAMQETQVQSLGQKIPWRRE